MNPETLKGHLDLLLLTAVRLQPSHGYAIAETLRRQSDGAFDLPEGTIYPALHRLERAGWLASRWEEQSGRRRRVYQLTARGRRVLSRQHREWREFVRAMHSIVQSPT
jgi:PadR family transcriptional regulator PadR